MYGISYVGIVLFTLYSREFRKVLVLVLKQKNGLLTMGISICKG